MTLEQALLMFEWSLFTVRGEWDSRLEHTYLLIGMELFTAEDEWDGILCTTSLSQLVTEQ